MNEDKKIIKEELKEQKENLAKLMVEQLEKEENFENYCLSILKNIEKNLKHKIVAQELLNISAKLFIYCLIILNIYGFLGLLFSYKILSSQLSNIIMNGFNVSYVIFGIDFFRKKCIEFKNNLFNRIKENVNNLELDEQIKINSYNNALNKINVKIDNQFYDIKSVYHKMNSEELREQKIEFEQFKSETLSSIINDLIKNSNIDNELNRLYLLQAKEELEKRLEKELAEENKIKKKYRE